MKKTANNVDAALKAGITGITGGLGRRLGELCLEHEFSVAALVRNTSNITGLDPRIVLHHGDICEPGSMRKFIQNVDICFHLAAQVGQTSRTALFKTNVLGTENICKAILEYNPRCRLIYCSTISTLRVKPCLKFLSSPYAVSKYFAEKKVLDFIEKRNLKATIIYPGIIYGGYDKSFMPQIIEAIRKDRIKFITGGERRAPLIHVDELCQLFIKTALAPQSVGKRYVTVKGIDIGIHDVIRTVARKIKGNVPEKKHPKFPYFVLALLIETFYRIFKKGNKPFINRTAVDILSINFKNYKKHYDDPKTDLDWEQNVSKQFFLSRLEETLPK